MEGRKEGRKEDGGRGRGAPPIIFLSSCLTFPPPSLSKPEKEKKKVRKKKMNKKTRRAKLLRTVLLLTGFMSVVASKMNEIVPNIADSTMYEDL